MKAELILFGRLGMCQLSQTMAEYKQYEINDHMASDSFHYGLPISRFGILNIH